MTHQHLIITPPERHKSRATITYNIRTYITTILGSLPPSSVSGQNPAKDAEAVSEDQKPRGDSTPTGRPSRKKKKKIFLTCYRCARSLAMD
ncbi:hypothetical protein E2C01_009795 [Portunus trituberculatus]|uniref:Uncharacterized protein n=1 Tax=Portunus trituberculatus TaxID=210409 RepID=A0A5B7D6Y4_PORTR|nr:hypothetical protein [Portunus trituberculatus]